MAKKGAKKCSNLFVFMCLFMFMSSLHISHGGELELLLSFKASIIDQFHFLSNWSNSSAAIICKWHGITCDNSSHIRSIELSGKNISGKITPSIFQLPYLRNMDLSNNQLIGEIPKLNSISTSPLQYLNLSNNKLTSSLPDSLFSISFSHFKTLDLSNNMLSGKIPDHIGLLSSLKYLDLGGNVLVGKIPNSITNLTSLESLTLASNQLVGEIPNDIGQIRSLKWIYFGYNNLSGGIPKGVGELNSLNHLDLVYNNLTGQIPESLGNLSNLRYLFLYQNKLTGPIPRSVFGLKKLLSLDISDNSLSGDIPELVIHLQSLEILHLFSNNFTGKVPKALASLPKLQVLQLWSNRLTGEIPQELGKHNNLTVLDMSTNNLSGKIPNNLCDSGRLYKLILFSNNLVGEIPNNLSSCTSLSRVRLQNNRLSGELSTEITNLPLVYFLDISGNKLTGRIDDRKWDMPALQMLNLANNNFTGKLPDSFGSNKLENVDLSGNQFSGYCTISFESLSELMELKLNHNKLSGEIPEELSSCKKLVALDLSHNQLTGEIPASLTSMPVLGLLDLSENQLSGEIPQNLGKLQSLVQVNISHNQFRGSLPYTGAFLGINASAVAGNNLCDISGISTNTLPACKRVKNPTWWFMLTCFLVALAAFVLAAFIIVLVRRRKSMVLKRVESEDGIWELQYFASKASKSITIDDILSSTKEENIISKGRSGISYKGNCKANGMQFMVKEINEVNSIPMSLWPEIVEFGKLRHPNIVKLIGICRSGKGGYLVYEYTEDGKTLSVILRNLSWERRRKIAVAIAKALKFLHSRNHISPTVLVGEMSPQKVLVDGKDLPRLRLSPPGLICADPKGFISSNYVAPEARTTNDFTEKSDIYGFGLILIELLTGKSPADMESGEQESMVDWARYCYSDCHLDMWIDPMMKGDYPALNIQNEMVATMNLALQCTAGDPTARPCASNVLKTLEAVMKKTNSCVSALKSSPP
ncbi:Leucine-rich receptor-like protein kinase family protein [Quillaja saponaria]|uniref:non-specific serine/threonine protein kinase n=1 Tax=Quillaja saponaria TaxID=32244 RepID=A0AAD7LXA5_QUISA|nr:Leucine-rich receptor-like protein kinase family protein [Quillaja saponaria]